MSDSELSDAPSNATPSDSELGKSLRAELKKAASRSDEYSVTSVREASEKSLGLPAGFYKNHATWKAKSKEIITTESVHEMIALLYNCNTDTLIEQAQ